MKRTLVALAAAFALVVTAASVAAGNIAPKKGPSCRPASRWHLR